MLSILLIVITLVVVLWFIGVVIAWFRQPSVKKFLQKLSDPELITQRTTQRTSNRALRQAANRARIDQGGRNISGYYMPSTYVEPVV
jgi:hypothetical protein